MKTQLQHVVEHEINLGEKIRSKYRIGKQKTEDPFRSNVLTFSGLCPSVVRDVPVDVRIQGFGDLKGKRRDVGAQHQIVLVEWQLFLRLLFTSTNVILEVITTCAFCQFFREVVAVRYHGRGLVVQHSGHDFCDVRYLENVLVQDGVSKCYNGRTV